MRIERSGYVTGGIELDSITYDEVDLEGNVVAVPAEETPATETVEAPATEEAPAEVATEVAAEVATEVPAEVPAVEAATEEVPATESVE
jgi:hypothetical protein